MLLTRLPLDIAIPFDLHVLGLPPAFVLSQDQTLKLILVQSNQANLKDRPFRDLAFTKY